MSIEYIVSLEGTDCDHLLVKFTLLNSKHMEQGRSQD